MKGKHQKSANNRKITELESTIKVLRKSLLEKSKETTQLLNDMPSYNALKEKVKLLEYQVEENTSDKLEKLEKRRKLEKEQYDSALISFVEIWNKKEENGSDGMSVDDWDTMLTILGKKNIARLTFLSESRNGRRRFKGKGSIKAWINFCEENNIHTKKEVT